MAAPGFKVETCPAAERADALRVLNSGLSPDQKAALPAALNAVRHQQEKAFAGLFVARQETLISGCTWVQMAPGRTAVVWPPAVDGAASAELMRSAGNFVDQRRIPLAQVLVATDAPQNPELLSLGGFQHLVDLVYLAIESTHFPQPDEDEVLTFVPGASELPERLGRLLLETYEQTLDCPQINGLRQAADILESYAAQGNFSPERWFFVQHEQQDVGVLLLAEYGNSGTWELIYMGILPSARGKGFGRHILRFALSQAKNADAQRLVLAADERNLPALDLYRDAGMVSWDRRRVYARLNRELNSRR